MIGWIFIAVAKSDRVLRRHSMPTIELVIHGVRSIAATARHCRTRQQQRKCGYTNQSKVRHNAFSFTGRTEAEGIRYENDTSLRSNAMLISCAADIEIQFCQHH
jgi:hypothetical protein